MCLFHLRGSPGGEATHCGSMDECDWIIFTQIGRAILNPEKTKVIQLSTTRLAKELSSLTQINVAWSTVRPSGLLKLLGVTQGAALSLDGQVKNARKASFFHIYALRYIRPSSTEEMPNYVAVLSSNLGWTCSIPACRRQISTNG